MSRRGAGGKERRQGVYRRSTEYEVDVPPTPIAADTRSTREPGVEDLLEGSEYSRERKRRTEIDTEGESSVEEDAARSSVASIESVLNRFG